MEFKDCVLFVSDGECPLCEKAKEIIKTAGFENEVQICSVEDIREHPLRNDIMMEVQFNNGALPVCIIEPVNNEEAVVMCGARLIRYMNYYRAFLEGRKGKGEVVK